MCKHGTYIDVEVINKQNGRVVKIDACIADEIQTLNNLGVVTLGCCCGHGNAGKIIEWANGFGEWKGHDYPPHTLIDQKSIEDVKELGYRPFPYYYADGEHNGVWQMYLKTGCVTEEDVEGWHNRK
jgi:hypothetical protein